jgi:uncharacterized membrane protein YfcA
MVPLWLFAACLVAAVIYASVGLGGGSAYLAFMALADVGFESMRFAALAMNLVVAGASFWSFHRAGHLRWPLLVPFLVTSLPAAFVGGLYRIPDQTFRLLLAGSLAAVAVRMLFWRHGLFQVRHVEWRVAWRVGPPIGAATGLLAGLTGIGGGIFLGPILIVMGWADAKKAGAVAAAFVWLNSTAGLGAHITRGNFPEVWLWPLLGVVLLGGVVGGRLGAWRLSPLVVQRVFGCVVAGVVVRLVWRSM